MSTKSILSKKNGLIKKTKQYCLALSNYTFKQRLIAKAEEFNCIVNIVDESYTSKTCGNCGEINNNLGKLKKFNCNECAYVSDRDINGARNILIKYLS
jgi:transposase